ncbi:MAG: prepilin-type N-terminal cleavage/methylation domain-containing protein [Acidobacteriota bacterium]
MPRVPVPRSPSPRARSAGFSLIELMIVVSIIGILTLVSIPVLFGYQERARVGAAKADARCIQNALSVEENYPDGVATYEDLVTLTDGYCALATPQDILDGKAKANVAVAGCKKWRKITKPDGTIIEEHVDCTDSLPAVTDPLDGVQLDYKLELGVPGVPGVFLAVSSHTPIMEIGPEDLDDSI